MGRPMGTTASPARHCHHVTSMAASVGPYRLCSCACDKAARVRSCKSAGSASPLQITVRKLAQAPGARLAANACSIDGTKCTVVTPWRSISAASSAGSRCSPGAATASRAPYISGQKNSHTETSKLNGVFCSTVSPAPSPYVCCIHTRRLYSAQWRLAAPFGRPVEPEV
ncbi:hypothetical protein JANLI_04360 [Janthinobacterium lividum]|nr:hypothetical protein JANLI_04360 [Janthinobacterium lividum]